MTNRLAYLYMTGTWPEEYINYRDDNPHNLRWNNLYTASHAHNVTKIKKKLREKETKKELQSFFVGVRAKFSEEDVNQAIEAFLTPIDN